MSSDMSAFLMTALRSAILYSLTDCCFWPHDGLWLWLDRLMDGPSPPLPQRQKELSEDDGSSRRQQWWGPVVSVCCVCGVKSSIHLG